MKKLLILFALFTAAAFAQTSYQQLESQSDEFGNTASAWSAEGGDIKVTVLKVISPKKGQANIVLTDEQWVEAERLAEALVNDNRRLKKGELRVLGDITTDKAKLQAVKVNHAGMQVKILQVIQEGRDPSVLMDRAGLRKFKKVVKAARKHLAK